jgi:hypothetical protein
MADEVARLLLGAIVTPSSGHATTNGAAPAPTTGYTSTGVATPTPTGPTAPAGMPATDAADAGVHESAADDERPDPTGQDGERPNPSGQDGERPDASGQDGEKPDPSGQDGERHGASGQDGEPPDPCGQDDEPPDPSGQDGEPPDPSGEDGERPDAAGEDGEWAGHHGGLRVGQSEQECDPAAGGAGSTGCPADIAQTFETIDPGGTPTSGDAAEPGGGPQTAADEDAGAGGAAARPGCDRPPVDDPVAAVRAAYQAAVERDRARQATAPDTGPPEPTAGPPPPNPTPRTGGPGGGPAPGAPAPHPSTADPPRRPADLPAAGAGQGRAEPVTAGATAAGSRLPADPLGIPRGTPVMINLVISDRTLFGDGDDPAILPGNHPIPAALARRMIADLDPATRVWIRRLYTHPDSGHLVAMDSRARRFRAGLRQLLVLRDQSCRTPYCDAGIRHADHLRPAARGGPTSRRNGQGTCEGCNYTREAPGWQARTHPDRDPQQPGAVTVTTPTRHPYTSPAPDLIPGHTIEIHHHLEQNLEIYLAGAG